MIYNLIFWLLLLALSQPTFADKQTDREIADTFSFCSAYMHAMGEIENNEEEKQRLAQTSENHYKFATLFAEQEYIAKQMAEVYLKSKKHLSSKSRQELKKAWFNSLTYCTKHIIKYDAEIKLRTKQANRERRD